MVDETNQTRRGVLRTGAGLATLATFAGCIGGDDGDAADTPDSSGDGGTPTTTDGGTTTEPSGGEGTDGPYTVSIEPVGDVEFDAVPGTWVANNGSWADMGVALGLEPPEGVWLPSRYHTQYYDEIPDVSVDAGEMTALYQDGVDKERFYDLNADVHVMDPNFLMNRFKGWSEGDVEEIETIAPLFGNSIFSRGYPWHEDYRYYTLYEAFGKLAEVFQRQDRYEAFVDLHEEFQAELADVVPPESDRPDVAVFYAAGNEPEEFLPYVMNEGTSFKQWNDLGVGDALANSDVQDFHASRNPVDYETLLEVDPDAILLRGQEAKTGGEFQDTVVSYLADHDVASQLTAVRNGDVYRGGPFYQGPITNLVLTERAARQVYDVDRELFDRERVGDVVAGDV
jgi:iron complex transport system substrate-binding protein